MASSGESEFDFIARVRQLAAPSPRVPVGIGDDAAVIAFPSPAEALVTVDMLMEGVDFTFPPATPAEAGRKALAVNLSDIAAMGGRPLGAVVSVALPRERGWEFARELHAGLAALAREFDTPLIGGDTNTWDKPLAISVTLIGEAHRNGVARRNGAKSGDWIMVTGELGGSIAGKHLHFTPRLAEARALMDSGPMHAMIDISDGLAADLWHILEESRAGARLWGERIPISEAARAAASGTTTALEHALTDGEDFELLFTVSPEQGAELLAEPPFSTRLSHIGEIVAEPGCSLRGEDGQWRNLPPLGWRHEMKDS